MVIIHSSKLISGSPFFLRSRQNVAYCRFNTVRLYSSESLSIFGLTNSQASDNIPSNSGTVPFFPYSSIAQNNRPLSVSGNTLRGPIMSK